MRQASTWVDIWSQQEKWRPSESLREEVVSSYSTLSCEVMCPAVWDIARVLNIYSGCLGVGNGNPLQYSCLENPKDRGIWQATVHGVAKSQTRLSGWARRHAGLSSSTRTLPSLMWRARPSVVACEIWFPNQGWGPIPLLWECGVLATRPPGKSQDRARL